MGLFISAFVFNKEIVNLRMSEKFDNPKLNLLRTLIGYIKFLTKVKSFHY